MRRELSIAILDHWRLHPKDIDNFLRPHPPSMTQSFKGHIGTTPWPNITRLIKKPFRGMDLSHFLECQAFEQKNYIYLETKPWYSIASQRKVFKKNICDFSCAFPLKSCGKWPALLKLTVLTPENGWLEYDHFFLGPFAYFRNLWLLVSGKQVSTNGFIGGLGPGGLRFIRDSPKNPNPFHFRGSNRNPNHRAPGSIGWRYFWYKN